MDIGAFIIPVVIFIMFWKVSPIVGIAALLGWIVYGVHTPIPKGLTNRRRIWINLAFVNAVMKIGDALHLLGIKNWYDVLNDLATNMPLCKIKTVKRKITSWDGVPVWMYTPEDVQPSSPCIFYMHGGGWTLSSPRQYDGQCMRTSRGTKFIVVSVDYRLAPKHPHPAPLDDCITVYKYLVQNAEELGVDKYKIVVMGDSAGGQLSATISLALRDKYSELPQPKLQVLVYPCTQLIDYDLPSYQQNNQGPVVTRYRVLRFFTLYLEGHERNIHELLTNNHVTVRTRKELSESYLNHRLVPKRRFPPNYITPKWGSNVKETAYQKAAMDPYVSPLLSESLKGLPKAYILVCEYDVLRDDGILYSERLRQAGNDVTLQIFEEGFHGIMSNYWLNKEANEQMNTIFEFITRNIKY